MSIIASFHHVSLAVADLDAEQRWYTQVLGLDEVVERVVLPEPAVRTVVLRARNGLQVELISRSGFRAQTFSDPLDAAQTQGYGHWAIKVDDLDAAFAVLSAAPGQAVLPPAPAVQPGARFAYVKDPEGNLLELIESLADGVAN